MDEGLETAAEAGRKRSRSESPPRPRSMSPQEPPSSPPLVVLTQPQQPKSKVVRTVNFESHDERMPDQKSPCASDDKQPKLEFDADCAIQDSEFAFLMCDETLGEPSYKTEVTVKTEPGFEPSYKTEVTVKTEPGLEPTDSVKKDVGCSRLFDSAKKFAKDEKTPLRGSSLFNTTELVRSASQTLASQFTSPPTTKRTQAGKKTPSSSCRMSQSDVFGQDTSSESDSD